MPRPGEDQDLAADPCYYVCARRPQGETAPTEEHPMKRQLAATTIALMLATMTGVLCAPLVTGDTAWARAGGGSSGGSRGSRGFLTPCAPALPNPSSRRGP